MTPTIGVIGAGRVGSALGPLLAAAGWQVTSVFSRTPTHAAALAIAVGAAVSEKPADVLAAADLTLLTVPDDAVRPLAEALADAAVPGRAVAHTSGALGADALEALAARGMRTGSLHPAFPFAGGGVSTLKGVSFAVEAADATLRAELLALVEALGGVPLLIPAGGKAQYHAALALASNYTVTLYALAERLLTDLGVAREAADEALNGLLAGTLANLQARGVPDALTGPLVRADHGTLRRHLRALRTADPALANLYRDLARLSLPLAAARGVALDAIERLLEEEGSADALDRT